jgi:GTPase Era involved in 16S rRNA processing
MARSAAQERAKNLTEHLKRENPVLAQAVVNCQKLDAVGRKLGVTDEDYSLANQISWWPVISVLGTYSAGKSTFINQLVGSELQRTGNQAVDDKFTVICHASGEESRALPGLALDSDPRFPFYQIGQAIAEVADAEGRGVDSYLQLKTCKTEALRGKILIDSPGFDADKQRTSTLMITEHIIDLSDLVLVFFDARHPEPGAMMDTLKHLVAQTVDRPDANKFMYILNQIDNAARDDNSEEVVAAWQRALAQNGLTAGRFYAIYARDAAVQVENEQVRERMERKRDEDLAEIEARIVNVEVDRAYRVAGSLEKEARHMESVLVPALESARQKWRSRTLWLSLVVFGLLAGLFFWWSVTEGHWHGLTLTPFVNLDQTTQVVIAAAVVVALWLIYVKLRSFAGHSVLRGLSRDESLGEDRETLTRGFMHNLKAWWHLTLSSRPRGWTRRSQRQVAKVLADTDTFVQGLNDGYANPAGDAARGR